MMWSSARTNTELITSCLKNWRNFDVIQKSKPISPENKEMTNRSGKLKGRHGDRMMLYKHLGSCGKIQYNLLCLSETSNSKSLEFQFVYSNRKSFLQNVY